MAKKSSQGDSQTPHPVLGEQFSPWSKDQKGEGKAFAIYETVETIKLDGKTIELKKPRIDFQFHDKSIEKPIYSLRMARPLVGLGLLEAVPEEQLLALKKAPCKKNVNNTFNFIKDPITGMKKIGRFGWKASKVSVQHQNAAALQMDMGVSNDLFPQGKCPPGTAAKTCKNPKKLASKDLENITVYMQSLGVPGRIHPRGSSTLRGEKIFMEIHCNACHTPTLYTDQSHPLVELRGQAIHPFTDLMIHDLGPHMGDNRSEGEAKGSQWRTSPLWGLGHGKYVNKDAGFLHDGRAKDLTEAILWHGGEALFSKKRFIALTSQERKDLISFLNSL